MAIFSLKTQGVHFGYTSDGFWAGGSTDHYEFDERDYVGHDLPRLQRRPIQWRIDTYGRDCWADYKSYVYPPENMTRRFDSLDGFFGVGSECKAVGMFHYWSTDEMPVLQYSFPKDPSLVIYVLSTAHMERDIEISGGSFVFSKEGTLAVAPTVSDWMECREPLFLWELPSFRTM